MTVRTADVVVIGGGVVGAATARALAKRGASVALLEAGSLGDAEGSSRGTARIICPAAYPDRSYLDAGIRALKEWRALEAESQTTFLHLEGALLVGQSIDAFAAELDRDGIAYQLLSADTVAERFGIVGIEVEPVLHQLEAGVIRADCARQALLRSAAANGAELQDHERVLSIDARNDRVELSTTETTWRCERAVITAGPWTPELVRQLGVDLALEVTSQSVAYFRPPSGASELPALIEFGQGDEPYALLDPTRGLKAALHRRGPEVDPDDRWDVIDTAALDRIRSWVVLHFPDIDPDPIHAEACLYTNAPDEHFILRRDGPIVTGAACDGQGFQFAPDTGQRLADLATEDGAGAL